MCDGISLLFATDFNNNNNRKSKVILTILISKDALIVCLCVYVRVCKRETEGGEREIERKIINTEVSKKTK